MNRELPLETRFERAVSGQEIERVLTVHNYMHAASRSYEEWSTIWSKRDDTSWAHAFGRMRGPKSIWLGSVVDYDQACIENYRALIELYPDITGMDYRPLYVNSMHTLANGIIEVADDGKTARASYLTPGMLYNILNPDGKRWGVMMWERYGMDFVQEDGEWKFLHYQVSPEFSTPFDNVNHARFMYEQLKSGQKQPPMHRPQHLDDPGPLFLPCTPVQPPQEVTPPPEPYETLDSKNTYTQFDIYPRG